MTHEPNSERFLNIHMVIKEKSIEILEKLIHYSMDTKASMRKRKFALTDFQQFHSIDNEAIWDTMADLKCLLNYVAEESE